MILDQQPLSVRSEGLVGSLTCLGMDAHAVSNKREYEGKVCVCCFVLSCKHSSLLKECI